MRIREETRAIHDLAENTEFSKRMVKGELSKKDYLNYLRCQFAIFQTIEAWNEFVLPHPALPRVDAILEDMKELTDDVFGYDPKEVPQSAYKYRYFMLGCTKPEEFNSHIYLNYMGMLFGGSLVAKNAPTKGNLYKFENRMHCIEAIRQLPLDIEQVKRGFEFHIKILEELQEMSNVKTGID
jgi:heme oxygenase